MFTMKNEIRVKVQFAYAFPITSIFLKKKQHLGLSFLPLSAPLFAKDLKGKYLSELFLKDTAGAWYYI